MANQTQILQQLPPSDVPVLLSPEEIYDAIMKHIEPELMTIQIPLLKEKYKDETPEQKQARGIRYKKAYEEYHKRYAVFQSQLQAKTRAFQMDVMRDVEERARTDESADLKNLEETITSVD